MSQEHYKSPFPTAGTNRAMATQRVQEHNIAPGLIEARVSQVIDSGTPADVGPIQYDFTGRDAQFWWSPVLLSATGETAHDFYDYRVIVKVGGVSKRTEYVRTPSFTYTYEKNVIDNAPNGATVIEIEVRARTDSNKLSATPTVAIATNTAPSVPVALSGETWASSLRASCAQNSDKDVTVYRFQISTVSNFASIAAEYAGPSNTHVFSVNPGTDYYLRVRAEDIFGQPSNWATTVLVSGSYVGEADLDGRVFQIEPTSSPAPTSGALTNLFDLDTATGATFASTGWVEYKYPVEHVFSMVRLHLGAAVNYYVQYHDGAVWQDILGSAAAPIAGVAGWNVQKFPRQIKSRRLRVQFLAGVTLNEVKFWVYSLADEILAQTMTLTNDLTIQSQDGKAKFTKQSLTFYASDGVTPLVRSGDTSTAQDGTTRGFLIRNSAGADIFKVDDAGNLAVYSPDGTATLIAGGFLKANRLEVQSITADKYAEIRNNLAFGDEDDLDDLNPLEADFYIPGETVRIVGIFLIARAKRFRATSKSALGGGSHSHSVTLPNHTHGITNTTQALSTEFATSSLTLSAHSVTDPGHAHANTSKVTGSTQTGLSMNPLSVTDPGHSHANTSKSTGNAQTGITIVSGGSHSHTSGSAGGHSHSVSGITDMGHSHSDPQGGATGSASASLTAGTTSSVLDHSHTITTDGSHTHSYQEPNAGSGHSHSVPATSSDTTGITIGTPTYTEPNAGAGHSHSVPATSTDATGISIAAHTLTEPNTGSGHKHVYGNTFPSTNTTESGGGTVVTSDTSAMHTHPIDFGIYLDTTPAGVNLDYKNDPAAPTWTNFGALATAPDTTTEYDLVSSTAHPKWKGNVSELDLTSRFSGTGWKKVRFTSTRRGRINYQLVVKVDLTA